MVKYAKIFTESVAQALLSLTTNKLRTILSLLGILIGIFSIIAVMSAVDSLEDNIKNGFKELGNDVLYVEKMPWTSDGDRNYWKYMKRPDPDYDDYSYIKERSKLAEYVNYCIFTGGKTIQFRDNSITNAFVMGATYDYIKLGSASISTGRYFTPLEYERGRNVIILGAVVAQNLFGNTSPIGETVKFLGQKFTVIGVLEKEGDNMFNFLNFDEVMWISHPTAKKYFNLSNTSRFGELLAVKANTNVQLDELKGEVTGILRAGRRLRPMEDNNFAVNELSMLEEMIGPVFSVMSLVGIVIGFFALIVGMFSVANIMFVSVKERTNIIGIKKALGATKAVILSEFLIESIILCVIGGAVGIALVGVVLNVLSSVSPLTFGLSSKNVILGVLCSILVGVISGFIPAFQASNLDPVEAIRQ